MNEALTKDKTIDKRYTVPCGGTCIGKTEHVVVASMDRTGEDEYMSWWSYHQVLQCLGCKTISFRLEAATDQDYVQIGENEWESTATVRLFPNRLEGRKGLGDEGYYLPIAVRTMYEETLSALMNSLPVLSGIGLRALVEAVCREEKADGGSLFEKIDSLQKRGVLTLTEAKILHRIRDLGNNAAHEAKPHTVSQLNLALDVVEHMLKAVYILPRQVEDEFGSKEHSTS